MSEITGSSQSHIGRGAAVITIVRGRHDHLRAQYAGLDAGHVLPGVRILVSIGDSDLPAEILGRADTIVLEIEGEEHALPLGRARNLGAKAAIAHGFRTLVFLDVDCVPGRNLVSRYSSVLEMPKWHGALLAGPVTYLPPAPPSGYDVAHIDDLSNPHSARPVPADDELLDSKDPALFWSLSFALAADTWELVGGFDIGYTGYGGEDTDFGYTAQRCGVSLCWVGGAEAFHQHHPVNSPPTEHLRDILRNASYFHQKWGWWPMQGWLQAFADAGLIVLHDGNYVLAP